MSGSLNKVMIIGNLGRDPELRSTGDGRSIANLNVATSERWKDKNGEQQERTEWHRIAVFGGLADVCGKYLKKGDTAYFEGRIQTRKWTDQNGQDRYSTEIVVDQGGSMQMLGKRGDGASASSSYDQRDDYDRGGSSRSSGGNGGYSGSRQPKAAPKKISDDAPFDDDIPF